MTAHVGRSPWRKSGRRSLDPASLAALIVLLAYLVVAVLVATGVIADEPDARVGAKFLGPGPGHWLGTDRLGRDVLARVLHGARIALLVGGSTAFAAVFLGSSLGLVAGWFGGKLDALVMGLVSVVQSIPSVLLLVAISRAAGRGLTGVLVAFALTFFCTPCRVMRGEVLRLREAEHVQAARVLGYGTARILLGHVLPSTAHLVVVNLSLVFVSAIKSEVILSYLGIGLNGAPSWGAMILQARGDLINGFYWQLGAVSVLMFVLVLASNVVADAVEYALDPRGAP